MPKPQDFRPMRKKLKRMAIKDWNLYRQVQRAKRERNPDFEDFSDKLVEEDPRAKFEKKQEAILALQQRQREAEQEKLEAEEEAEESGAKKPRNNDDD